METALCILQHTLMKRVVHGKLPEQLFNCSGRSNGSSLAVYIHGWLGVQMDAEMEPEVQKEDCFDRDELFKELMAGNWDYVTETYKKFPLARKAKVTRAKHTVLHLAVAEGDQDVVKDLVNALDNEEAPHILRFQNDNGDTPLHVAAALGLDGVCRLLAQKCEKLVVDTRNNASETPLYVAAHHGKKKAFFALQSFVPEADMEDIKRFISFCRRGDGNNIIHAAVHGEYFDLAYKIIHLYPQLVSFHNEIGESPLHLLANKPLVFKSGSKMRRIHKILYACIIVDPLEPKYLSSIYKTHQEAPKREDNEIRIPQNYGTCVNMFGVLVNVYKLIASCFGRRSIKNCYIANEERQTEEEEEEEVLKNAHAANEGQSFTDYKHILSNRDIEIGKEHSKLTYGAQLRKRRFPRNYITAYNLLKFAIKFLMILLGIGVRGIENVRKKKMKHTAAYQVMKKLVEGASNWKYDADGKMPENQYKGAIDLSKPPDVTESSEENTTRTKSNESLGGEITQTRSSNVTKMTHGGKRKRKKKLDTQILIVAKRGITEIVKSILEKFPIAVQDFDANQKKLDTPILIAAKRGITEIVKSILEKFPIAVQDFDANQKNIVLLAVEYRQPQIYKLMLERKIMQESIFGWVDKDGNSALHLAAYTDEKSRPWVIPGAALQMQWEIKWYKFVKNSVETNFFQQYNNKGQTAREIFSITHEKLIKDGGEWLTNTSQSCSVVAALIATVAFASATSVPGGVDQSNGSPVLQGKPAFTVFAISALVALCCSVTSLITFLSILTSRYQETDFHKDLPVKLIIGLTSLFMSIGAMLISFCAGHFFVVEDKLKYGAFPIYIVTCLPATLFAFSQFPLYIDLIRAAIVDVPERTYKSSTI